MIKSEITDTSNKGAGFPKLMVNPNDGAIVLMTSQVGNNGTGMVLTINDSDYPIGDYYTIWPMCNFQDYKGTVTLTNK